jgi:hypothetical protein
MNQKNEIERLNLLKFKRNKNVFLTNPQWGIAYLISCTHNGQ